MSHNTTQVASVLDAATDFFSLWTLISGGGELICETKKPMQKLEPKVQGDLHIVYVRGGCNRGILQ